MKPGNSPEPEGRLATGHGMRYALTTRLWIHVSQTADKKHHPDWNDELMLFISASKIPFPD